MTEASKSINIVYIAGYGRSGSTLLERILGAHETCVGLGEVAYLADTELTDFYWQAALEIPLWRNLAAVLRFENDQLARRERLQLSHESRSRGWISWLFRRQSPKYRDHCQAIFGAVADDVPTGTKWLIDSSKTARSRFFRPFQLARVPGISVRMIHLVRDPRGSVQSVRRGSNAAMEQGRSGGSRLAVLRAAYGWMMANLAGVLFRACHGADNYQRIRYEELAENPHLSLARISRLLELDLSHVSERVRDGDVLPPGDQFAGNRMRLESAVRLRPDERWKQEMPRWMQWMVTLLCLPASLFVLRTQKKIDGDTAHRQRAA